MNFKENLIKIFANNNISINDLQINNFEKFYNLLIETNKTHNLTAITDKEEVITKHFLDSILPINIIPDESKIIDIGCGAGFPSIPLKIMNSSLNIFAIDSVGKKVDFVENTVKNLEISENFTAIHTRIEDLAKNKDYRETFDFVVSRAVAPLSVILEYSAPFLKNNGYILSYKGTNYADELKNSENALKILNCKVEEILKFNIPELNTTRYILKIKKFGNISTKYPRGQNKPRIIPL